MSIRSKIKTNAKKAMTQNYIKALSITLIVFCVLFLFAIFVTVADLVAKLFLNNTVNVEVLQNWSYILSPIIVSLSLLVQLILFSPLLVGTAKWFFHLVSDEKCDVIDLFEYFSSIKGYFGSVWLELNLFIRKFVILFLFTAIPIILMGIGLRLMDGSWNTSYSPDSLSVLLGTMLLIAGCVLTVVSLLFAWIFLKRYFLVRYLFGEERSVHQAFKQSVLYTKGKRTELFFFDFSFIGWFISCIFIIPIFYVVPYLISASSLFAKILIEYGDKETIQPVPLEQPKVPDNDINTLSSENEL